MPDIVLFAVPLFVALMGLEFAWGRWRGRDTYRLGDTLASLSQGLLSQVLGACTLLLTVGIYALVQARLALWPASAFWTGWAGIGLATLLYDFCDYWLHRASHRCTLFWAAHVVHHQSQEFNLSTALRQESLYPVFGFPFFLPLALLGVPPSTFAAAGVIVLFYQFWIHTGHVGQLGWFDRVFSSPSNHRVHHAVNDGYVDRNYAAILIVWDRLFGTYAAETEPCVYGARAPLASWDPLRALAQVFLDVGRQAARMRRWADRLRIWWMPPEWLPGDLRPAAPAAFDLAAVPRYDPPLSASAARAACAQFLLTTLAAGAYLARAGGLVPAALALGAAALVLGLWLVGALLEGRIGLRRTLVLDAGAAGLLLLALY